jgi:uncharacterized protein (TIGR02145 family)
MKISILLLTMLPVICLAQVNSNGEKPACELLSKEISPNEMKRNASFNVEEIKVRWKKAALENCTGVPCVVTVVTPPAPSFTCGTSTISDIDGNVYETVSIGTQCWTKTNLKVTKYNNGDEIPDSTNSTWGTAMIGARTENKEDAVPPSTPVSGYVGTLGYLYNWYAATDSRKLCPDGWHIPTDAEWTSLIRFFDPLASATANGVQGVTAGAVMKSAVTNTSTNSGLGWNPNTFGPGTPGTNTSDFSGLPGGFRTNIRFSDIRVLAYFWSATQDGGSNVWIRNLTFSDNYVDRFSIPKSYGLSVRCLRD